MQTWLYAGFVAFVLVMLALDLGVLNRGAHVFSAKRALAFTGVTIVLSLMFGGFVYWAYDADFAGLGTRFREMEAAAATTAPTSVPTPPQAPPRRRIDPLRWHRRLVHRLRRTRFHPSAAEHRATGRDPVHHRLAGGILPQS